MTITRKYCAFEHVVYVDYDTINMKSASLSCVNEKIIVQNDAGKNAPNSHWKIDIVTIVNLNGSKKKVKLLVEGNEIRVERDTYVVSIALFI